MSRRRMTDAHKEAIREGRKESSAVKAYLDQLSGAPRRNADPKAIERRIANISERLNVERNSLKRVELFQQRENLEASLAAAQDGTRGPELERAFIAVAKSFSVRKGIGYKAWRAVGVPAEALKAAGISRSDG